MRVAPKEIFWYQGQNRNRIFCFWTSIILSNTSTGAWKKTVLFIKKKLKELQLCAEYWTCLTKILQNESIRTSNNVSELFVTHASNGLSDFFPFWLNCLQQLSARIFKAVPFSTNYGFHQGSDISLLAIHNPTTQNLTLIAMVSEISRKNNEGTTGKMHSSS